MGFDTDVALPDSFGLVCLGATRAHFLVQMEYLAMRFDVECTRFAFFADGLRVKRRRTVSHVAICRLPN